MFPVMSQPSASPFRRPKKNIWRKPSLKSKQLKAQWNMRRAYSGSSQTATLNQELNSTLVLRSYPPLLSVQPRPTTPWSPYRTHQYPSSVPVDSGRRAMAIAIGLTGSSPDPPPTMCKSTSNRYATFVLLFKCFYILLNIMF